MRQRFKVLFYLKRGKGRREDVLPVYVRLTVDGKRIEWSVQQSCEETKWNKQGGRMYRTKEEAKKADFFFEEKNKPLGELFLKSISTFCCVATSFFAFCIRFLVLPPETIPVL